MSVRQRTWKTQSGRAKKHWMIDVKQRFPDGRPSRHVRVVSPVQTRRDAEEHERQIRRALLAGTYGRKEGTRTLEAFAPEFMGSYVAANNKPSEQETKRIALRRHLLPFFGRMRLDAIGPREVERFKAEKLTAQLSHKTVNNLLTMLRKMLSVAVEWGLVEHVPMFKWLRVPEQKFDFLSFEEAGRLLAAADGEWRAALLVGMRTGLRQGELLALRWDDVDLVAGKLLVRQNLVRGHFGTPKNGRTREVALSPEVVATLKAHRHLRGELVFCDLGGQPFSKGACKWPLWRACRRAGLRRIGWHTLRHTFASHLVMSGAPMRAVQELLGHATMEMTMRYAHLSPEVKHEAVARLDRQEHNQGTRALVAG